MISLGWALAALLLLLTPYLVLVTWFLYRLVWEIRRELREKDDASAQAWPHSNAIGSA